MLQPDSRQKDLSRAYVVGASKERVLAIRKRLERDGIAVAGHCDHPRGFLPPKETTFVLLITDMGCHAALDRARAYCRLNGMPCVGGLWRTWSTTRQRLLVMQRAAPECAEACPLRRCAGGGLLDDTPSPAGRVRQEGKQ